MKKTSKILSFILGAAMAVSVLPSMSASADYRYYPMEDVDIKDAFSNYEYFNDNELYRNHEEFFSLPVSFPIIYRSLDYKAFFWGTTYIPVHLVNFTVSDNDKFEEIYSTYEDELGLEKSQDNRDENRFYLRGNVDLENCESQEERDALIDEQNANMQEEYEMIMNMCSEMYEAGCISEATYLPYSFGGGKSSFIYIWVFDIEEFGNVTHEEIEEVVNSVPNMEVGFWENNSGCGIGFIDDEKGTIEDLFAVYDALKEKFGDELVFHISDYRIFAEDAYIYPSFDVQRIDLIAELEKNTGIAYGDANIDDHIGVQDAIVMNKSIVGAVELNEEQKKVVDLNKDNDVNSEDLNLLLRYLVDDVDTLPIKK